MNRSFLLLPVALGALAISCAAPQAPSPSAPSGGGPRNGGVMNVSVANDIIDYDPSYNGKTSPGDQALAQVYNSLMTFKNGPDVPYADMVVVPELAQKWEVTPDGKSFTFHLRQGVKWANLPPVNGREFTADDVKWTVQYITRTGAFADKKLPPAIHAGVFYQGFKNVEVIDKYTVKVDFEEPFVPFLSYAASSWNPVVAHEIYDADGHLKDRIIGTGPYQLDLAASQKGTRWVWKKNADYFQPELAHLDEVRWLVIPSDSTKLAAFQTKQIDALDNLGFNSYQNVKNSNPQATVYPYQQVQGWHLHFSLIKPGPMQDVRVRRAMSMGLDREEFLKISTGGQGEWAATGAVYGLMPQAEVKQLMKYDAEQAKKLLADAGYANGFKIDWPYEDSISQENLTWFQLVQAQWKKIGIDLSLTPMDKDQQRQKRRVGDFDIDVIQSSGLLEADADSVMTGVYYSKGSTNYGKSKDPEVDKLLDAQRREADPEKRRAAQREAVRKIVDVAFGTEIIYPPKWDLTQSYVKGYTPHFSLHGVYVTAWLDK